MNSLHVSPKCGTRLCGGGAFELQKFCFPNPGFRKRFAVFFLRYVASWIDRRQHQSEKANLTILFDKYVPACLDKLRTSFKTITSIPESSLVQVCLLSRCVPSWSWGGSGLIKATEGFALSRRWRDFWSWGFSNPSFSSPHVPRCFFANPCHTPVTFYCCSLFHKIVN